MNDLIDKQFPTYCSILEFIIEKLMLFYVNRNIDLDAIRNSFVMSVGEFVERKKLSKDHGDTLIRYTKFSHNNDGKVFVDIPEDIGKIVLYEEEAIQREIDKWKGESEEAIFF